MAGNAFTAYESYFSQVPEAGIKRSRVSTPSTVDMDMNFGKLYPIYVQEVLPGMSQKIDLGSVVRMSTPLFPVMDQSYLDLFAFYCPNRLVWNHWEQFCGRNDDAEFSFDNTYSVPFLSTPDSGMPLMNSHNSIFDYMGLPVSVPVLDDNGEIESFSPINLEGACQALPFRAYVTIWNEWFRDQNTTPSVRLNLGDDDSLNAYVYDLLPVAKLHDRFTSALPSPQRGDAASLVFNGGIAPVYSTGVDNSARFPFTNFGEDVVLNGAFLYDGMTNSVAYPLFAKNADPSNSENGILTSPEYYGATESGGSDFAEYPVTIRSLVADVSQSTIATVNQLRQAVAVQHMLETMARSGNRYTEFLKAFFNVTAPDARLQRPELLGHLRYDIAMQQVIQTSFEGGSENTTPLGSTGAYSKTVNLNHIFEKSYVEHGWVIIVACARTALTYQQGLERQFSRKSFTDYFLKPFENIGEMPVYNREIFFQNNYAVNDEVFGYQEAWSEYRVKSSRVAGSFRSDHPQSLDAWHYAQYFKTLPRLSTDFMNQPSDVVGRTLAVQDPDSPQLICNFWFNEERTLPMQVYSIPGLDRL